MTKSPDVVPIVNHNPNAQQWAIDGGKMDGWAKISGCAAPKYSCLTYYTPSQIPNLANLATNFAVSDRTFSMYQSASWGGHVYVAAATLDGFKGINPTKSRVPAGPGWGCDSDKVTPWSGGGAASMQPSCVPDYNLSSTKYPYGGAFESTLVPQVPTIFDRIHAAGGTFRIYGATVPKPGQNNPLVGYPWAICPNYASCIYTAEVNSLVPSTNVLQDAAKGTLPDYSVVLPSSFSQAYEKGLKTSQHNGESMLVGDNWIGAVVNAIGNGPEWQSTAIFITYDDCGCFYDHVPPPVDYDGVTEGPREPMVIVSPYTKAGYTDTQPATVASILAFTEHNFGLAALGVNDGRAYDYRNSFDFTMPPRPAPHLTDHTVNPRIAA